MQYMDYGRTGLRVSRFGLGCMRYPSDKAESIKMVRYALDNGVNYLDTAYVYGESEVVTGKALKDGYRQKAVLATKCPVWMVNKHSDYERLLDEQLKRLGTDYVDVYLLHSLNHGNWESVKRHDGLTFMDKMVKKGKIRHTAFSFHGTLSTYKEIINAYDFEMAQIQLNILDEYQQAGIEGMEKAAEKGMAVVVMEPLRGGFLVDKVPDEVKRLVDGYPEKRPLIEWCFRWLYDKPEVTVVLSGTGSVAQLKQNMEIFDKAECNILSDADIRLISDIKDAFEGKRSIGCTACRYCMPCPNNVEIPEIFRLYNSASLMHTHWVDRELYKQNFLPSGTGADRCTECGLCMTHCPQGLKIPERLREAHAALMR